MNSPSRSQPNSERDDFTRRMMSNIDGSQDTEIASLKARIEELTRALEFIAEGYENHDISHVNYRVKVYQVALAALEAKHD